MTLKEIAAAAGGELLKGNPGAAVNGISTDSREDCSGTMFMPLSGERFDGNDFVQKAVANGAAGYFWSRPGAPPETGDALVIRVADALIAYHGVANANRKKSKCRVTGITGSSGKTTTRGLLENMLSKRNTVSTLKNENNEVGVPKTLLRIGPETEYAVIEMGMRARGEIEMLARTAAPDFGIITNVGLTHVGLLGSEEEIAEAKGELLGFVNPSGMVFLNADNRWTPVLRKKSPAEVITYGMEAGDILGGSVKYGLDGVEFEVNAPGARFELKVHVPGDAGVYNALAAAALGLAMRLPVDEIREGLALPVEEEGRMRRVWTRNGKVVLDDSYNANPGSMRMALDLLGRLEWKGRKVAALADMLELGDVSVEEHYRLGLEGAPGNADVLVVMGPEAVHIARGAMDSGRMPESNIHVFGNFEDMEIEKQKLFESGDLVLVKGSRGMKTERIVRMIQEM